MTEVPKNVQDVYPLTPDQETVLIRSLVGPGADEGILAVHCALRGTVDPEEVRASWQRVCDRRAALRTSVHWRDIARPVQVVHRSVEASFEYHDLASINPSGRASILDRLLDEFRKAGVNLNSAPAVRLLLAKTNDEEWQLSMLCHHVLLDGWSAGIIIDDVLNGDKSIDEQLGEANDFKQYVKWLSTRSSSGDIDYWRQELAAFRQPCLVGQYKSTDKTGANRDEVLYRTVDRDRVNHWRVWLRSHGITESTWLAGTWALSLSRFLASDDVAFALTTSGRPPEIAGIEKLAGLFTRSVPLRVQAGGVPAAGTWLQSLQRKINESIIHQYCAPAELARCFPAPVRSRPFDSLLTIENYPINLKSGRGDFSVERIWGDIQSAYPITVVVIPGEEYQVQFSYDPTIVRPDDAAVLCDYYCELLHKEPDAVHLSTGFRRNGRATGILVKSETPDPRFGEDAPSSPVELRLLRVWQTVLGSTSIGVDDNFFDVGGTSVLAAGLFAEIERTLGKRLPLAVLLEAPTVRALASMLSDDRWQARWRSLVPIRTSGDQVPVFCVHAQGGNVLGYRWLAEALGRDRPFYALQSLGLNADEEPLESIEQMAEHYLSEIRSVQGDGPYILMGHCFGSKVAFEMASRLRKEGKDVGLLCVLDSEAPEARRQETDESSKRGLINLAQRIFNHFRARRFVKVAVAYLQEKVVSALRPVARRKFRIRDANSRAAHRYVARPFDGRILLIRASEDISTLEADRMVRGWEQIAKAVDVHVVSGDHQAILRKPHVNAMAKIIVAALESCESAIAHPISSHA